MAAALRAPAVDEKELHEIEDAHISKKTRHGYLLNQRRFLRWMWMNSRHLLSPAFIQGVEDLEAGPSNEYIDDIMGPPVDKTRPPLLLVKADGSKPGASTYNGHRSALYNLYEEFKASYKHLRDAGALPEKFKGLKHDVPVRTAHEEDKATIGNDPSDALQPTGIPLYGTILAEIETMRQEIGAIVHALRSNVEPIVQGVVNEIQDRARANSGVTYDGLLHDAVSSSFLNVLQTNGVLDMVKRYNNAGRGNTTAPTQPPQPPQPPQPDDGSTRNEEG
jgi:hypothetical protein